MIWTVYCGYKDPKKEPKNIQSFMPLEGDDLITAERFEPPSQEKLLELDKSFRSLFGKNVSATTIS